MGWNLMSGSTASAIRHLGPRVLLATLPVWFGCASEGGSSAATPADLIGTWDVNTTLVAASAATNPSYKEGDLRTEVWTISGMPAALTLKSSQGTIAGTASSNTGVFDATVDTGLNLKMKVHIECFLNGTQSMKGTIKSEYFGTFDNYIGLDAWTFEALRR
jgi:hypothetical protein